MRLAYLVGRYPAVSHTFILREVLGLRALGADVDTISIWRSAPEDLLAAADRQEDERTYALLPARKLDWLRAHVAAFTRSPGRWSGTLARGVRLAPRSPRGVMLGVSWFLEAMVVWDRCRRRAIRHIHVHLNGTGPAVALLATRFGGSDWSFSMTVHGPSEFYDVSAEALPEKVRAARWVMCISDFARSQLMALVEEEHWSKMHVVQCGVDPDVFSRRPIPPEGDALRVLLVGRLTQVKGHAVLLHAVAELASRGVDVRATLVGDGPKRDALERIAAELNLESRVRFTGSVSQEDIRDYYAAADVFCMASMAEGVPVVLMEAMAMEIPVVAPAIMGIPELIEDGRNGVLVRPARHDLLADALARLAADPAERLQLGAAGRQTVLDAFDIRDSVRQLHAIFDQIDQSHPVRAAAITTGAVPAMRSVNR
jgi:glycosyltransferase involved in cell wall biosynthesis